MQNRIIPPGSIEYIEAGDDDNRFISVMTHHANYVITPIKEPAPVLDSIRVEVKTHKEEMKGLLRRFRSQDYTSLIFNPDYEGPGPKKYLYLFLDNEVAEALPHWFLNLFS